MLSHILFFATLLASPTHAQEPIPPRMVNNVRMGRFSAPANYARGRIAEAPDDLEARCLLGITDALRGAPDEALANLELSEGSALYEQLGIRYHADTLRLLGAYHDAAQLRAEQMANSSEEAVLHHAMLNRIKDYRLGGDYPAALEAGEAALALGSRPAFYAALADVYTDMGDFDTAWEHIQYADWLTVDTPPVVAIAEGRLLLAQDMAWAAVQVLRPALRRSVQNITFWALFSEAFRLSGNTARAQQYMDLKNLRNRTEPELIGVRARLLQGRGEHTAARALVWEQLALYPNNRTLQAIEAELVE